MKRRVLLCDDEIHILRAAEFKLLRTGFDVTCASDGQEAWERIQIEPPDMLVTDFQMPRMSGLELIRHVRSVETTKSMPVVLLTAKGLELSRDLVRELSLSALLDKPFSPRELARLLQSIAGTQLSGSRSQSEEATAK